MNEAGLRIVQITPLCQLQDLGRLGFQSHGVTRSGAADPFNFKVANVLLGNPVNTPCLEFALIGGEFEVLADRLKIAFAGHFELFINDTAIDSFCTHSLQRGDHLRIGAPISGVRGYLSVLDGFECTPELNSCATHLRSGLGGFTSGMAVGSLLPTRQSWVAKTRDYAIRKSLQRPSRSSIRLVAGPQQAHFTERGLADFYAAEFSVQADSDRMGIRLQGKTIEHAGDGNIISDPVLPGSVQIPASGDPIILMVDGPTTGGYPKIGTVASVDIGVLGQLGAGETIRFEDISVADAQQLAREEHAFFTSLAQRLDCY
ncbi:MAG: biotin-dependent carboxyltransferase family protein [Pseudomonadales bacterium]